MARFKALALLASAAFAAAAFDPLCLTFRRPGRAPAAWWKAAEKSGPFRPAARRYSEACVLSTVAGRMRVELRADVPAPRVRYESSTPLSEFQDAIEPQWGLRPDAFLNAYVAAKNEIYIMDDAEYYERLGRFVDDSLAHEFTHFIQVRYKGASLEDGGDALEGEAIEVQTWFRESFLSGSASPACR